ncbi:MAG: sugar phosphate isomerase/epimerase family protein [Terracidiphilus sp.]|jgi:sugar phosphate isomerase/epimerase
MVNRRQFVKTVGLSALAGAGMRVAGAQAAAAAQSDVSADKSKLARLLPGCCAYSYDKELRNGPMTMEEFIFKAVELKLAGVDMTVYYLKSTDPEYLNSLRHLAYKHCLAFSGAACGVSMVQADAAKRAESINLIKKWVDVTDQLGASHLRIFAGELPQGASLKDAVDWVVESMKAACDYSGKKGITLGVEDHEGVTQNADLCVELMQRVNSPYAGINLDITNFIATPAQDAYAQIAACIPYATNIHIRDHFYDHTPVDMDRVWKIFAQAGHQGFVSAEYEAAFPDSLPSATGVPILVEEIQALCKKYSSV